MARRNTNPNISAITVQAPHLGVEFAIDEQDQPLSKDMEAAKNSHREARMMAMARRSREFESMAERIAQDKLFYRNHVYQGAKNAFPFHLALQMVDKYFPYAEGGPLYIDEPGRTADLDFYKEKVAAMKTLGHRYVLIKPGMTEMDIMEELA